MVAITAFQLPSDIVASLLGINNPGPILPGWLMPYMLGVTADQIGHPVADFVLVKTDNFALHVGLYTVSE